MIKKESLSEFQGRFASRLQGLQGADGADASHWLAVEVGGHKCLFPLVQSGEIFPWSEPHPVPYTKDWFVGVANLRGALCGVVNLSRYLGGPSANHPLSDSPKLRLQERQLIGFHPALEISTVLIVDRLLGLKSHRQMKAVGGLQHQDETGQEWREIDLHALSQNASFIDIAQ